MAVFVRTKRVTEPLDDKARARLVGMDQPQPSYVSSGSEHSADDSACLSELVHGFLENDSEADSHAGDPVSEPVDSVSECSDDVEDILRSTAGTNAVDSYKKLLVAHVSEAVELFSRLRSTRNIFRRNVMTFLRDRGHNAAICKTKWDSSGGLSAGSYEFIDVIHSTSSSWQSRYFVELDLAAQFDVARPTDQYVTLLRSLPKVLVCRGEELKKLVKIMCDVAKRSLRSRGLSVPPWRKNRYMQNKWFGPYRRTANPVRENTAAPMALPSVGGVKCRFVGFDNAVLDVNVNVNHQHHQHRRGFFVCTR
ncbi:uncharacterized protein LOC109008509 [Juglans regia]|uniref:Uncharacterized protein LOC109008509 n=1 Tax=Juglans regia TaxID=51240 RepID=A0A2I4GJU9_JUGRE|nr:uncharacterized protein LOC109008509 [Juglans regia]